MYTCARAANPAADPVTHTTQPIVTGSSVLAIKYKDGVMMAADTLASYGSMARFKDVRRIREIGHTLVGAGGEYGDFQAIVDLLENMHQSDRNMDDGYAKTPKEYFNYLRAVMYQRRNKFNPLWNHILVAGVEGDQKFLGFVDLIGTAYEESYVATGFGAYIAMPIIRSRWHEDMDEGEARGLLEDCLRVLFYRDTRASNRVQLAKVTQEGTLVSEPYELQTDWEVATYEERHGNA
jgi:20S proteasome subunit beta 7